MFGAGGVLREIGHTSRRHVIGELHRFSAVYSETLSGYLSNSSVVVARHFLLLYMRSAPMQCAQTTSGRVKIINKSVLI